jgi:hypothetical protein
MPSADEAQFETTFSNLAYVHLRDRAPKLLDYLIGFQLLDKNEDDTKAAGVFGIKIEKTWLYVVSFFIRGELKGCDSIYIKSKNTVVPLEENWVNYILSRKPSVMGGPDETTMSDLAKYEPSFNEYFDSPFSKNSFCEYDGTDNVYGKCLIGSKFDIRPCLPLFYASPNSEIYKKSAERTKLASVVREYGEFPLKIVANTIRENKKFADLMKEHIQADDLVYDDVSSENKKELRPPSDDELKEKDIDRALFNYYVRNIAARGFYRGARPVGDVIDLLKSRGINNANDLRNRLSMITVAPLNPALRKVSSKDDTNSRITVVTDSNADLVNRDLTREHREDLVREGFTFIDKRASSNVSTVLPRNGSSAVATPTDTGFYSVFGDDGVFHDCFIINGGFDFHSGATENLCIIDVNTKKDMIVDQGSVLATHDYPDLSLSKVFTKVKKENMVTGNVYFFKKGNKFSLPFNYIGKKKGNIVAVLRSGLNVSYPVSDSPPHERLHINTEKLPESLKYLNQHVFIPGKTASFVVNSAGCFIPDDVEIYKIAKPSKDEVLSCEGARDWYPGDIDCFEAHLIKSAGLVPVTVMADYRQYRFPDSPDIYGRKSMVSELMTSYGLSKNAALSILNEADSNKFHSVFVKTAVPYADAGIPIAPSTNIPVSAADSMVGVPPGVMGVGPSSKTMMVPGQMKATPSDYNVLDDKDVQTIFQLAQTGEKEVMDTGIMASLIKTMDISSAINKYISDLMVGLDRLGRILIMFYWHIDKFAETYGEEELTELETSIKDGFSNLGNLVLFLKKKEIDNDFDILGGSSGLEADL